MLKICAETCYKLCSKCSNLRHRASARRRMYCSRAFLVGSVQRAQLMGFLLATQEGVHVLYAKKAFTNLRRPTTAQKRPHISTGLQVSIISHTKVPRCLPHIYYVHDEQTKATCTPPPSPADRRRSIVGVRSAE